MNEQFGERQNAIQLVAAKMKKLLLVSDPLRRTYAQLRVPLYLREPGCWLPAPYGEGKTIAIEYCARRMREEIPGQPVFIVNEYVLPGNELRSFFVKALIESNHDHTKASMADVLRNRLARYWAELSSKSPLGCVVLLLDEGQSIRPADEKLLKDLGNSIASEGGDLQTFVFGESPGLDTLVAKRKATSTDGATDRLFCGHKLTLSHYKGLDDWRGLFKEMDNERFDELGNLTILESFFGHMDISQCRLESEASTFFRALETVRRGSRINLRRTFVGIRYALMMSALLSLKNGTSVFHGIGEDAWLKALRYGAVAKG